ncbi:hypothetical protein [Methanoregula sp.]|uniref:hypothetical protein n=1 Tax=Methanoregula sp. TaxID=2052170 RepID=UPI00236A2227|nr:hypothetical protein [Methanoregula sp.]MDD1686083.1 hypothetical protein [Methanoregula sp.]
MSSLFIDLLIWILLAAGVGFGGLGFFGLLIFPDIRSRMFTASRATLIAVGLVSLAVLLFGVNALLDGQAGSYGVLVSMTIFLFAILAFANFFISRILLEQVPGVTTCTDTAGNAAPAEKPE